MTCRVLLFADQVAGALAMWAVLQSPYPCPDNLETVVRRVSELWPKDGLGMSEWSSEGEIYKELQRVSEQVPELLAWNERKNGNPAPLGFCSRYDKPDPDNDFIDLHALWGNVARSLWNEEIKQQSVAA